MAKSEKLSELRLLREELDLSQARLGELLGVEAKNAQATCSRWETGNNAAARQALNKAKAIYKEMTGREWRSDPVSIGVQQALAAPFHMPTPGFPEKEIVRATEMVLDFMGAGRLTPFEMGGFISAIAERLVLGETESMIRSHMAAQIRTRASAEARRLHQLGPGLH